MFPIGPKTQLITLQLVLIWPLDPVIGLRFPILTIALAKSVAKLEESLLYSSTSESVDPPLKRAWSEEKRPFWLCKFWKYELSNVFGVVLSSGAKLSSPPVVGQFSCNDVANVESMLLSL